MSTTPYDWLYIAGAFLALLGFFFFCSVILTKMFYLAMRLFGWQAEEVSISHDTFLRFVQEQKERMDTERNGGSGHFDRTGLTRNNAKN